MGAREVVEREYLTRQQLGYAPPYESEGPVVLALAAKIDGLLAAKVADIMADRFKTRRVEHDLVALASAIEHGRFPTTKPEVGECKT